MSKEWGKNVKWAYYENSGEHIWSIISDPIKPQSSKKPVGRPPKSKAEENTVKEYTLFLKKKIKILGRMPSTDENKKFFAEFNRLKNKDKKRKTEVQFF